MSEDIKKSQTEGDKPETDVEKSQAEGELSEDKLEDVAGGLGDIGPRGDMGRQARLPLDPKEPRGAGKHV